jgi:hypothetical protein
LNEDVFLDCVSVAHSSSSLSSVLSLSLLPELRGCNTGVEGFSALFFISLGLERLSGGRTTGLVEETGVAMMDEELADFNELVEGIFANFATLGVESPEWLLLDDLAESRFDAPGFREGISKMESSMSKGRIESRLRLALAWSILSFIC